MSNSTKLRLLGALAVVLVVVGIVLVVTGDDEPTGPSTTTTTVADGQAPTATLPLDDTSVEGVSSMAGLVVPDGAKDFLTAATENKAQLDVTFTLPSDQVEAFVSGSGFPALVEGEKVVTHSSPLWKLNPEGTESGAAGSVTVDGVTVVRAVETVPEGDRVRVRLVLTPGS
ncbi:MAG TPA: hypothetical protein PKE05_17220 [Microthrixaceae bacterium]|nr:hypothetical protein [Microthrixaceae bacterium]